MWNYRLVRDKDNIVQLCEVYYNDDNKPFGYCNATIIGEDKETAEEDYNMMREAFDLPVLDVKTDFNGIEDSEEI